MNEHDSIRGRQDDREDEEQKPEESIVDDAEKREEGPAADKSTVDESVTDAAASLTQNEQEPAAAGSGPDTAGPQESSPSSDDGALSQSPGGWSEDTAETAATDDRPDDRDQRKGGGETGSQATGHDEDSPPQVTLKAGTDEESLRALNLCREKVKELRLHMHPIAARYDDDKHVIIFFRAEEKVDFRKLVRELSRTLHARIEMRQLGPREQGKLCGLVGKCGYPLCCRTFLGQFAQSSIRMAKTQDLALNPMKISGVCGRLLCCLNYEQEMYADVKSRMPKMNKTVDTEFGRGRVTGLNVLKGTITVQFEVATRELPLEQVHLPEARGSQAAEEGTSATQHESRNSGTEHDSRTPGEDGEH